MGELWGAKKKFCIVCVVDDQELAASTAMAKSRFNERLNVCLVLFDPFDLELSADLAVGVLEADGIYCWDPVDGAVRVRIADLEGGLERDLRLPDPSKAFDGRSLTVVLVSIGGYPLEQLRENRFASDKVLVAPKGDRLVTLWAGH